MAANVESMFSGNRIVPWHGLGEIVAGTLTSEEAIKVARLDWDVTQERLITATTGVDVPDHFANVRSSDHAVLGIVGNRYQIVQNRDAFSFTDSLIGEGCVYESAGSLCGGTKIWLLAKLPDAIQIAGDEVTPYLLFSNTHDGSGAIKVCPTPIRVVCNNTLNLALKTAKRTWSARHTGSIEEKLTEATETLGLANQYYDELKKESERLALQKIDKDKVIKMIDMLIPVPEDMNGRTRDNLVAKKNDIFYRYMFAPDLRVMDHSNLRFIHAVADTVDHMTPTRRTKNYDENHFLTVVNGSKLLDDAYALVTA